MTQTNTAIAAILKQNYTTKMLDKVVVREHPLLRFIERKKDFFSQEAIVPLTVANNRNISADIATAIAGTVETKYVKFAVTPVKFYGVGNLDGIVVTQAEMGGDPDHFIDALKNEFDSVLEQMGARLAKQAYGNKGGALARIQSGEGTDTITLTDPSAAVNFAPGDLVCGSDTDGTSGSLRDSGEHVVLSHVDYEAGTLKATTTWSTDISGLVAGDYLFIKGDFGAVASGLEGWNPTTAPDSTTFFGLDRSPYSIYASGVRYTYATNNDTIDLVIQKALRFYNARAQTKLDALFMHPDDLGRLEAAKEGGKFIDSDKTYGLGIEAFRCHGVDIVQDSDCPVGKARGLRKDSFTWKTCGTVPMIERTDGLEIMRSATADSFELRAKAYHNFLSAKPRGLLNITLPTS